MKNETKHTPDFDAADDAASRVSRLCARPEPNDGTWNVYLGSALAQLDLALLAPETIRVRNAAPDLLAACKELLRSLRLAGQDDPQAAAAIAKAEGRP